jgi:hypothetical protein
VKFFLYETLFDIFSLFTVSREKLLKRLSYEKFAHEMLMKLTPGVNLINILHAAFALADPKSAKNTVKSFFSLLGSASVKAAHKMLIKSTPDEDGWTPLHHAIWNRNLNQVTNLLSSGADPRAADNLGQTVIHLLAWMDWLPMLEEFVENGANIEDLDSQMKTPLLLAAEKGHHEILQYLLKKGANKKAKSDEGFSVLHLASMAGNLQSVQCLIDHKCNIESRCQFHQHFMRTFLPIFMCKIIQSQNVTKEKLYKAILYKKLRVKC